MTLKVRTLVIIIVLAVGSGLGAGILSARYYVSDEADKRITAQAQASCRGSNESRAAIRGAFAKLVDAFVANSPPASQPRIRAQGDVFLTDLAKALPTRRC